MNIQINTQLKEITVISPTTVRELIEFIKYFETTLKDYKDYTIVPNNNSKPIIINTPHTGSPTPYKTTTDPYAPPYTVTC